MVAGLELMQVLLVDDNRHTRRLVRAVLGTVGIEQVLEASDGQEAFDLFCHNGIDLIVTDWEMTRLDGLTFVNLVRSSPQSPRPDVPILMLTSHARMERVRQAREAGIDGFVVKPFSARTLLEKILSVTRGAVDAMRDADEDSALSSSQTQPRA
ncbi:MAG: response regulator [Alphaproteobacteria bacterium]